MTACCGRSTEVSCKCVCFGTKVSEPSWPPALTEGSKVKVVEHRNRDAGGEWPHEKENDTGL